MTDTATIVRLHSLGDVVLAQPAATALAVSRTVRFVTCGEYVPVVRRMPGGIVPVPIPRRHRLRSLSAALGDTPGGEVFDLQGNLSTWIALFPGKPAGRFSTDRAARRKVLSGDGSMPLRSDEFASVTGICSAGPPVLERRSCPPADGLRAGIVIGGRWPMKSIPDGIAAETARLLSDLYGAEVTLLGGHGDSTRGTAISTSLGDRCHVNAVGEGGVDELIRRIEELHVLISPDSGPAHIAAALGVPVLVVFTSTSPELGFWPRNYPGTFMVPGLGCRPCHRHGGTACPRKDEACRNMLVPLTLAGRALEVTRG